LRWSAEACELGRVGTHVAFGIVPLCRRDRRHGKPGGLLHLAAAAFREHGRARRSEAKGRTRRSVFTRHGIGIRGGRWVKGAKAGWKAGRRLESLPHKNGLHHESKAQTGMPALHSRPALHQGTGSTGAACLTRRACPTKRAWTPIAAGLGLDALVQIWMADDGRRRRGMGAGRGS